MDMTDYTDQIYLGTNYGLNIIKLKVAWDLSLGISCIRGFWYLFKKIRDTKGTFHAKKGTIKDRNGMDLTEPEDVKKW